MTLYTGRWGRPPDPHNSRQGRPIACRTGRLPNARITSRAFPPVCRVFFGLNFLEVGVEDFSAGVTEKHPETPFLPRIRVNVSGPATGEASARGTACFLGDGFEAGVTDLPRPAALAGRQMVRRLLRVRDSDSHRVTFRVFYLRPSNIAASSLRIRSFSAWTASLTLASTAFVIAR